MASDSFLPLQGMSDIAPPEVFLWQHLEAKAREVLSLYGFSELRCPLLERTGVFTRSIGDTTDVVQKEMYSFEDRGGRAVSLRPEGTASVMRYAAGLGAAAADSRFYYIGPMFRCERPQAGRKRQFHQLGVEVIGEANAAVDAETIALQLHLLRSWGLEGCRLEINTRGLPEDRSRVAGDLRSALEPFLDTLPDEDRRRYDENVLRILDSKNPATRAIVDQLPPLSSFMGGESERYLKEVTTLLDRLEISYDVNPRLVRGLDYYMHTVWEITHPGLGAQDALAGGGRYRMDMDGSTVEGVGFALGLERVVNALTASGIKPEDYRPRPRVWLVSLGETVLLENFKLVQALRQRGVAGGMDLRPRSMKAQMRSANRAQAGFAVIRGDQELEAGTFLLKHMATGEQRELELPQLMETLLSPSVAPVS